MIGQHVPSCWIGSEIARKDFPWTPIAPRPTTETLAAKIDYLENILTKWESHEAWIAHTVFRQVSEKSATSDKWTARFPETGIVLMSNQFPYQCPPGTAHSVLWMVSNLLHSDVTSYLRTVLPCDDFVWYYNPKPSISCSNIKHAHIFHRRRGSNFE